MFDGVFGGAGSLFVRRLWVPGPELSMVSMCYFVDGVRWVGMV